MDLTVTERVKKLLDIDADNSDEDDQISLLINAVSDAIQNYIGRYVGLTTHTEYFSIEPWQQMFQLKGYPVSSITTVYNDTLWVFGASTAVGTDYLRVNAATGILYVEPSVLVPGFDALKVIYIGGLAEQTEDLFDSYADLAHAAERQVAYWQKTRTHIGAQSLDSNQGGVSWQTVAWLPEVKAILDNYRCLSV